VDKQTDHLNFVFVEDLQQVVRDELVEAVDECCHLVSDAITEAPFHHQPVQVTSLIATTVCITSNNRRDNTDKLDTQSNHERNKCSSTMYYLSNITLTEKLSSYLVMYCTKLLHDHTVSVKRSKEARLPPTHSITL